MPQEVHPPQEALFSDTRIFIHAPQFHWHGYGPETMDVDKDAKNQIMDLADLLHTFGRRTEAREKELWGRVQETLRTQEVHQPGIQGRDVHAGGVGLVHSGHVPACGG